MNAKHEIIIADYHGCAISFTDEGWFNATAVAARYRKEPAQWMRLPSTVAYLKAFERKYGNFTYLKTRRGHGGGTWLHPKLAVRFAQW
ncbi:KilA-N domain-containing protein, partial [Paraburkholderia sp.]|uniref:KilA-N domain-containing protein n=1 Tax=Paraburkholderia sp. TaxID=1926495 RepID=UPI002F4212E3